MKNNFLFSKSRTLLPNTQKLRTYSIFKKCPCQHPHISRKKIVLAFRLPITSRSDKIAWGRSWTRTKQLPISQSNTFALVGCTYIHTQITNAFITNCLRPVDYAMTCSSQQALVSAASIGQYRKETAISSQKEARRILCRSPLIAILRTNHNGDAAVTPSM